MKRWIISFAIFFLPIIFPQPVFAHAFGRLYNLPVPFWLYLYAAAAALILSFMVVVYFLDKSNRHSFYPNINLSRFFLFNLKNSVYIRILKTVSLFFFLLTITSGFIGQDNSYVNFNMTFFWIYIVLGLTYLVALFGNIYVYINPWKILIEIFEKLTGSGVNGSIQYPKRLGYYPALFFYFLFIWIELSGQSRPYTLSMIITIYTVINLIGVSLIGKKYWFSNCEFFGVFFRLIGKIAILENRNNGIFPRPLFSGLVNHYADHISLLLFILFMLSSTAYDGIKETILWERYVSIFPGNPVLIDVIHLLISPLLFFTLYVVFMYISKVIIKSKESINSLMLRFSFSLIPIAFAYNIAHYYNLILGQGQDMIRLISDPFGFGWNLFGTAAFVANLSVIDASITWHMQVLLILLGHIAAVYTAHVIALKVFPPYRRAIISQIPTLLLMVTFTVIGLWILALPVA